MPSGLHSETIDNSGGSVGGAPVCQPARCASASPEGAAAPHWPVSSRAPCRRQSASSHIARVASESPQRPCYTPCPGADLNKYEILERVAIGGMGEVFLAEKVSAPNEKLKVILKSLLPALAADPSFVGQFIDEARLASILQHPNVVSVFEVGQWEGRYLLAMEYIEGKVLSDVVRATRNGYGSRFRSPLPRRLSGISRAGCTTPIRSRTFRGVGCKSSTGT